MTPGVPDATAGIPPPEVTGPRAEAAPPRPGPAPETARLYAIDWQTFVAWCQEAGLTAFLAAARERISAGALGRRAAAIGDRHRQRGLASPTADAAVRAILRQTRRTATPRRKPPQRPTQLQRMAAACPGDLAGMRDRALLLLAAAGLGRAALVGLDADRLRFTATAVELTLPQPGPDADRLRSLVVPCGATLATCPVQALRHWLDTSGTRFGPVFRKIDRWGNVEHPRLGTDAIRRILARRTPRRVRRPRTAAA